MSTSCITHCPRCGTKSYENLNTHSHCLECLYSSDLAPVSEKRNFLTLREAEALIAPPIVAHLPTRQKKVEGFAS